MFKTPYKKLVAWLTTRFTRLGHIVLVLTLFCGLAGMNTAVNRVYMLFGVCFGFFLVAFFLSVKDLSLLKTCLQMPEHTTAGETIRINFYLKNSLNEPFSNLRINLSELPDELLLTGGQEKEQYINCLRQQAERNIEWEIICRKRGIYEIQDLVLEKLDPFGLMRSFRRIPDVKRVVVYPRFHPLKHVTIPVGRRYQPGGVSLSSNVGDSVEFFSIREFRDGDDISKIHWKSWAKHGKPVVKEFQEEYFSRVALILDTCLSKPLYGKNDQKFENAVSLTASITNYFSRQEYLIDVFAAGPYLYHLTAGRALAFQEQILEILACVEPSQESLFHNVKPKLVPELQSIASVILILLDWDKEKEKIVEELLEFNCVLKVIVIAHKEIIPEFPSVSPEHVSFFYVPVMDGPLMVEEI